MTSNYELTGLDKDLHDEILLCIFQGRYLLILKRIIVKVNESGRS